MGLVTFSTPDEAEQAVLADRMCRWIGSVLLRHYPNRQWFVEVSMEGGVAKIQSPSISNNYGFVVHIDKPREALERAVVRAGGELLERFGLSRERAAIGGEEAIERDIRGEAIHAATGI